VRGDCSEDQSSVSRCGTVEAAFAGSVSPPSCEREGVPARAAEENLLAALRREEPAAMRIVKAKTYIVGNPWKNWVFVRLETDEGIYGIGEGTLNGFAKTPEACTQEFSHFYMGMDLKQIGFK
jgi:Mandelate racemase / muconate lactonizing enzyme, N-terminal domain